MNEPMPEGKSHVIPKQVVWEAWLKVKKNGGAAGVNIHPGGLGDA
jgi:RNA-directed DNA polymerase